MATLYRNLKTFYGNDVQKFANALAELDKGRTEKIKRENAAMRAQLLLAGIPYESKLSRWER